VGLLALQAVLILLAAVAIFGVMGAVRQQASMLAQLGGLARVVAANATSAVAFEDSAAASATLASLAERPEVVGARIVLPAGGELATFPRNVGGAVFEAAQRQALDEPLRGFPSAVRVEVPLFGAGDEARKEGTIGSLVIVADLTGMWSDIRRDAAVALGCCIVLFLLAMALALRMQGRITGPVLALTRAARTVSESERYDARIEPTSDDEIGELVVRFNQMLERIRVRDERLRVYSEGLEETVAARTAQLTQALNDAQAASRAKSEFLATMSHEIRTPMNGVLGMTELLQSTALSETQRHYADSVMRSGRHLLGILNDVLDFSKIESGRMTLEAVEFDVQEVCEECLGMFAQPAAAKGLELALQFCPPDAQVRVVGDPFRLRQVIANLLSNAIKFTEHGVVVLRLVVVSELDGRIAFRIEVADTGVGVAQEARARIFEHFSQADGSTTRRYGGTGLGLAICKSLVELMGGWIELESELGAGATFIVDLRLPKGSPRGDGVKAEADLRGVRALVVDDNATNREILRLQLESWQMVVEAESSGKSALERIDKGRFDGCCPDVCVLDMCMPEMDGVDLARRIRERPWAAAMRLIMLTSACDTVDPGTMRTLGIARCLNKPIRRSDLQRLVAEVMTGGDGDAAVFRGPEEHKPFAGKVLLAEDNETNQLVAVGMLNQLGLSVTVAQDGREAVLCMERQDFDLVLMDCQMPEMDGYEATRAIREREEQAGGHVPIIALTANVMASDRQACLSAGMDDYLGKPYRRAQLEAVLRRWLVARDEEAATSDAVVERSAGEGFVTGAVAFETEEVISKESLEELAALDPAGGMRLVQRMFEMFLSGTAEPVAALDRAAEEADAEEISRRAHWLKSSASNVGALRLAASYKALEDKGREGKLLGIEALVLSARTEYARVVDEVQRLLAERG